MRLTKSLLVGVVVCLLSTAVPSAAAAPSIKVLIVTGDDVSPPHNWLEVSTATRELLLSSGKFDVKVSEDAGILESTASLNRYDLVFLSMYNAKTPTLSAAAKENLLNFVKGGKGITISHLASASFKEWNEFRQMCGRYWVMGSSGHGPRGKFTVKVSNRNHPITQGLEDFEADDELYAKLQGDSPINVLAEADSSWSKRTEPLVFTLNCGQGRVFHETFGHDAKALQHPSIRKIIQRGCQWAATGKVD